MPVLHLDCAIRADPVLLGLYRHLCSINSPCKTSGSYLCLQLAYNESSEGTLGPFNVEAKLTSVGGSVLYATGSGRVSLLTAVYT